LIDKRSLGAIFALIAVVAVVSTARADDSIAVIVGKHPPHISLDRSNLEDIFLKRILVDDDRSALVPLNLASTDPIRLAFSVSLLGERPEALQRYWTERYFHGITPPYTVRSQESMLRYVADTPGAVGYVASCSVDDRVNVAARLPVPAEWASQIHRLCEKSGAE
jgi:ABC-type phosphate transport system substrate-binding protein